MRKSSILTASFNKFVTFVRLPSAFALTIEAAVLSQENKLAFGAYSRVYSSEEAGFVSEDKEMHDRSAFLSAHFKKTNIRTMDEALTTTAEPVPCLQPSYCRRHYYVGQMPHDTALQADIYNFHGTFNAQSLNAAFLHFLPSLL